MLSSHTRSEISLSLTQSLSQQSTVLRSSSHVIVVIAALQREPADREVHCYALKPTAFSGDNHPVQQQI